MSKEQKEQKVRPHGIRGWRRPFGGWDIQYRPWPQGGDDVRHTTIPCPVCGEQQQWLIRNPEKPEDTYLCIDCHNRREEILRGTELLK